MGNRVMYRCAIIFADANIRFSPDILYFKDNYHGNQNVNFQAISVHASFLIIGGTLKYRKNELVERKAGLGGGVPAR